MIKKSLLALSFMVALFSCKNSKETQNQQPTGWQIFETPVNSSLRGLSPLTDEIAWVSGSGGTWMRTIDGGKTWDHGVIANLDSVDFRSIYAFNAEMALVVSAGQPAVIYKTTDGGKTWELKHTASKEAFLDGIDFSDQENGYVIGDPEGGKWTLLKTFNQGESWYSVETPAAVDGEAAFAASATSLLSRGTSIWIGTGGTESNIHYSNDQGATWQRFKSPLKQGTASQGIFSITSLGNGEVFAVGGDYLEEDSQEGNAAVFSSTEKKWLKTEIPPAGYRSGIAYFPKNHCLVTVGPTGSDFSVDGGLNWQLLSPEGFHAVKLAHAGGSVWASGADGKVGKLEF